LREVTKEFLGYPFISVELTLSYSLASAK